MSRFDYVIGTAVQEIERKSSQICWRTNVGRMNNLEQRIDRYDAGTGANSACGRDWLLLKNVIVIERDDQERESPPNFWNNGLIRGFRSH
ncbi:hypothetical protein [Pelagibius sp. Alg239-R121]|uniref:hypothetical protein n=1 Tax=Pelagibius sp. Alg239-R121 TaxID=2993448 RepID=UPI0024A68521|nr:hypothetical protein [Pelagibius sp. Alg239-R121]